MISVIYEDNHLLVLNKPAGLLTQPSGTDQYSLQQAAKEWLKLKYAKPGNVFLESVHRLDKSASGIVVFGKTSKAVSRLNLAIKNKHAKKIYYAWVEGCLPATAGTLEDYLIHGDFKAQVVNSGHPEGKLCRLHYQVIQIRDEDSLLEINLETGRYHQIRAQLAARKCPIWGDQRYGSKRLLDNAVIALHHYRLSIQHPTTQELLNLEAPLPSYFTP